MKTILIVLFKIFMGIVAVALVAGVAISLTVLSMLLGHSLSPELFAQFGLIIPLTFILCLVALYFVGDIFIDKAHKLYKDRRTKELS